MFWVRNFFSNPQFHFKALSEVVIVSAFAIFPLLLLPIITSLKNDADVPFEWSKILMSALSSGQLYIYSFSTFGTIMWLCLEDVSDKPFPPRKWFGALAVLSGMVCLIVYSFDPSLTKPLNSVLVQWSIAIYVGYLLMYYALLVFKLVRAPDLAESLNEGASRLMRQSRENRAPQ